MSPSRNRRPERNQPPRKRDDRRPPAISVPAPKREALNLSPAVGSAPAATPTTPAAGGEAGRMLYLHALSPIHSGVGQSAEAIDLPAARERVTGWPYLPGSSVKGVLRDACEPEVGAADSARWTFATAFGPPTENASDHAGGLWFADARLLCFPVRSLAGGFAWLTCPLALRRWRRDYQHSGAPLSLDVPSPAVSPAAPILLTAAGKTTLALDGAVYLEDLDLEPDTGQATAVLAIATRIAAACFPDDPDWRGEFAARFGIVGDDAFTFLTETATEVVARIKLDPNAKTVEQGGFWYEEAVPPESIFACPLVASRQGLARMTARLGLDERNGARALFALVGDRLGRPLQIGGGASIGRGIVQMRLEAGG